MRPEDDWSRLDNDRFQLDEDYPDIFGEQLDDGRSRPPQSVESVV